MGDLTVVILTIVLSGVFPLGAVATASNKILQGQSILYGLSGIAKDVNRTSECFRQLQFLGEAVDERQVWAIKALDASGQPESGFLYGNNLWLGSHGQCRDISNKKNLEVNYEKVQHQQSTPYDYPPFPLGFCMAYLRHNSTLQHHTQMPLEFIIQLGICLPQSCQPADMSHLLEIYINHNRLEMQNLHHLHLNVVDVKCLRDDASWMLQLPKTIILLTILGVILLLTILGTFYDVRQHNRTKNMITGNNAGITAAKLNGNTVSTIELVNSTTSLDNLQSTTTLAEALKCFSIYSNVRALVKTTLPSDSIAAIHGVRFFSMLWVIMVHSIFYQADYLENVPFAYRLSENIFSQILSNSTYGVDTYLFLSGFLVAYLFFKSKTNRTSAEKPIEYLGKFGEFWLMIINRLLRLTPPYLILILITDVLYTYQRQASSLLSSEQPDVVCPKFWWRNILYINNLYPRSEMCLSWSWYLSIDTQFFIFTSFVLILSTIAFKLSVFLVLISIVINVIATTYKSYSIRYIPTMDEQLHRLDAIYDLPWNRIGPYLVGVITGFILIVKLQRILTLTKKTKILLWIVFPLLNLWILFTLYTRNLSVEFSAIYMGVSRTLWGVGLGWLLVACCTGNARLLEKFLSFKGFIPLSRLTYCAYLLNPLIANMLYLGAETSFNASLASFGLTVLGVTLVTFYLSFVYSIIFESPFILLTKLLFTRIMLRRHRNDEPPNQQTA